MCRVIGRPIRLLVGRSRKVYMEEVWRSLILDWQSFYILFLNLKLERATSFEKTCMSANCFIYMSYLVQARQQEREKKLQKQRRKDTPDQQNFLAPTQKAELKSSISTEAVEVREALQPALPSSITDQPNRDVLGSPLPSTTMDGSPRLSRRLQT